jgi:hypothetical protein
MKNYFKLILIVVILFSCEKNELDNNSRSISFEAPQRVTIIGYDDHAMEPFLSRDGNTLFFNNSNHPSENTNIHFASRVNDLTFQYQGLIEGVNTEQLDGVPTLDRNGNFYFVSTNSYLSTLASIYSGSYSDGVVSNIQIVQGVSKNLIGWLNFDVEVSSDGNFLFFVDGRFDDNGGPYEADILIAMKLGMNEFVRLTDQSIMKNINTSALEYAACISSDMLELYFTRVDAPLTENSSPKLYVATRETDSQPFCKPYMIQEIDGFVEAATLSANDSLVYFHKYVNGKFEIHMCRKD